jgi:hypothetical protein
VRETLNQDRIAFFDRVFHGFDLSGEILKKHAYDLPADLFISTQAVEQNSTIKSRLDP